MSTRGSFPNDIAANRYEECEFPVVNCRANTAMQRWQRIYTNDAWYGALFEYRVKTDIPHNARSIQLVSPRLSHDSGVLQYLTYVTFKIGMPMIARCCLTRKTIGEIVPSCHHRATRVIRDSVYRQPLSHAMTIIYIHLRALLRFRDDCILIAQEWGREADVRAKM